MIDLKFNYPVTAGTAAVVRERLRDLLATDAAALEQYLVIEQSADTRQWIADAWKRGSHTVAPEQVFVAATGHNALTALFTAILKPGDAIAVDPITYSGTVGLAAHMGYKLVPVPGDADGMLPDALARVAGEVKAVYLMPNVHNPLSVTMPLARREALVAVARAHDLWLVDDDAYGFLEAAPLPSLAHLAPERAFYLQSMTKPLAPAVKVAVLLAPPQLADKVHAGVRFSGHGPSRVYLHLLRALVADGTYQQLLEKKQAEARVRQQIAKEALGGLFPATTHPHSFHLWLPLPAGRAADVLKAIADAGVGVIPHQPFAASADVAPGMRVALGGENDPARLRQALEIIAEKLRA